MQKQKIALIIDSESWAFANIAAQIVKHLHGHFDFRIIPASVIDDVVQILLMTSDCAITHFFWRDFLFSVSTRPVRSEVKALGFRNYDRFLRAQVHNRKITTSVYDHLFLTEDEIAARSHPFHELVSGYTVCSQQLLSIYQHIEALPDPNRVAQDGVDLERFRPLNLGRLDRLGQRPMVIGWAGNSAWAAERGEDFKGLHTLLRPAVEQLQQEGLNIRLELADRQQGYIPHEQMAQYYAKLDLYVCPSKIEGTPNPVLEATACGVPVISTRVGVVPELLGDDPFNMILPHRDVPSLKQAIKRYYLGGSALARRISAHGLAAIGPWSWARKAENFRQFFHHVLYDDHDHRCTA